jgi:hypothetical protein
VTGRVVRWLANLALIAVILGIGVWNYTQVNQAEKALCSLRDNLEVRVAASQQYLDDVRSGKRKPIVGITEADITTSIQNQQQTLDALSNLNCKRIGDA